MAMNKHVQNILEGMGIKADGGKTPAMVIAESERTKVHPHIAKLLAQNGIIYEQEDIEGTEGGNTPLDAPGSAPLYNKNTQSQQRQPGNIQLKDGEDGSQGIELDKTGGAIETVDDLAAKMGEISETMRLIDLTIQTVKTNAKDSSLKAHKNRFRDDIEHLSKLVNRLQNAVR